MKPIQIAACLGLAVAFLACGATPSASAHEFLEVQLELSDDSLKAGQSLGMTLVVTNKWSQPIALTFSSSCQDNFQVRRAGQLVWDLESGRFCAQVLTVRTLEPGETVSYERTWDQTGNDGAKAPAGDYEAVGQLLSRPRLSSSPKPFVIRDS